jgi:hypothetical protein
MKSPFLVFDELLSPLQCEEIIIGNNNIYPNYDKDGKPQPLFTGNRLAETRIIPQLEEEVIPLIEKHYNVEVKGIKSFIMEWYPAGYDGDIKPRCENSVYMNNKWIRSNSNDFAGIIFLNDYRDTVPFDPDYEVFGAQLEFLTHDFSFNPRRGTLIVFPGVSNFINHTAKVEAGELTQIRFHVATHELFVYDMNQFPGNYKVWFNEGEE